MGHAFTLTSIAASVVVAALAGVSSTLLAGAALIAIVGGIVGAIYTAKSRTQLAAVTGAANAWRDERDAERAKADRLEHDLRDAESARHAAEARTDITRLERLVTSQQRDLVAILDAIKDSLRATTTAVEFLSKHTLNTDLPDERTSPQ